MSLKRYFAAGTVVAALAVTIIIACAEPPDTAPAHGWRKKHEPPPPPPPPPQVTCRAACESTYAICWRAEEAKNLERWNHCLSLSGAARDSCIAEQRRLHFQEAQACLDAENACIHACP